MNISQEILSDIVVYNKYAKYLPKYMIPINIFKIKTLPRNNNQKIDENKLLRLINGKGIN